MLDTAPVNDQHNFARLIIYINDDINHQRAERLLSRAYSNASRIPGRRQIVRQVGEDVRVGFLLLARLRASALWTRRSAASQFFSSCAAMSRLSGSQAA